MAFTAKDVQALREKTGCGMMDCKKALTEAGGDMEKAIELLREKGLAAAAKKSSRIAAEGMVHAVTNADSTVGVVLEVNAGCGCQDRAEPEPRRCRSTGRVQNGRQRHDRCRSAAR